MEKQTQRISWYYVPIFIAFWILLFLAVSHTQLHRLPRPLQEADEATAKYNNSFIAERAERILIDLTLVGPKVLGTAVNEVWTVEYLLKEISQIIDGSAPVFEFEVDVQEATGIMKNFAKSYVPFYGNIQNIAVKLRHRVSNNDNYLLINSHYDTVAQSPGAGDDGSMVVVMLEVMRVISKSPEFIEHPIVFLFNGAEEAGLLGSHAFITQHKWAKNCKTVINLDAAGNSGREALFQSGPKNGWVMDYYGLVPHPFGMVFGEELFQAGAIPSDTDFRIFRDYGSLNGLDMAYITNGYVYHTSYDRVSIVAQGALQHTGDNVLALARGLANAPELNGDVAAENEEMVYFDYLGWFLVVYTKSTGAIMNYVVCATTLIAIVISMYFMHRQSVFGCQDYGMTFLIQILSIILACGLPLLIAFILGLVGHPLSWFTAKWLIFGMYFCPIFFGLLILPAIYVEKKNKTKTVDFVNTVQLFMHFHCICLIVVTIVLTAYGIRSAYLGIIAVFFDHFALVINLVIKSNRNVYYFGLVVTVCQIPSFLYLTYFTDLLYDLLIPTFARSGPTSSPDFYVAFIAIFCAVLFAGFILPLLLLFRKSILVTTTFAIVWLFFITMSFTPVGFPFTARTATERLDVYYSHRTVHDGNTVLTNDSGIVVQPLDSYMSADQIINFGEMMTIGQLCQSQELCGLPYTYPDYISKYMYWLPTNDAPPIKSPYPNITLISSEISGSHKILQFSVIGPDRMNIFMQPIDDNTIKFVALAGEVLEMTRSTFSIFATHGKFQEPLQFSVTVEIGTNSTSPSLMIALSGYWLHEKMDETDAFQQYIKSYSDYVYVDNWLATYENWQF